VFGADFIRSVLLENDVDARDEFVADRAEGSAMRFALLALAVVVRARSSSSYLMAIEAACQRA